MKFSKKLQVFILSSVCALYTFTGHAASSLYEKIPVFASRIIAGATLSACSAYIGYGKGNREGYSEGYKKGTDCVINHSEAYKIGYGDGLNFREKIGYVGAPDILESNDSKSKPSIVLPPFHPIDIKSIDDACNVFEGVNSDKLQIYRELTKTSFDRLPLVTNAALKIIRGRKMQDIEIEVLFEGLNSIPLSQFEEYMKAAEPRIEKATCGLNIGWYLRDLSKRTLAEIRGSESSATNTFIILPTIEVTPNTQTELK